MLRKGKLLLSLQTLCVSPSWMECVHKQNYNDVSISSCGVHPSRKGPIVGGKKTAEFNRPLLQNTLHIQMHFKPAKSFFPSFFLFSLFPSSSPSSSLIQDCRIAAKKKSTRTGNFVQSIVPSTRSLLSAQQSGPRIYYATRKAGWQKDDEIE